MTALKFLTAFLALSLLASCNRRHSLSKNDKEWIPYRGDETLVFASNKGDTDTIFFLRKDTLIAHPDAQDPLGVTYQEVTIFCKHSDPAPPDGQHRYLENPFVEIKESKDRKARLFVDLNAKDASFYRLSGFLIDSLTKQKSIKFQTAYSEYGDVYLFEDEDWGNFKGRSDYVTKLYWSKSQGLIRYDKKDGVYWELARKYGR